MSLYLELSDDINIKNLEIFMVFKLKDDGGSFIIDNDSVCKVRKNFQKII